MERNQVGVLLARERQIKALVIKLHCIVQGLRTSIVEVGCARSEPSQNRTLDLSDVGTLAGDHCATDVGDLDGLSRSDTLHGIDWQSGDVECWFRGVRRSADPQG